MEKVVCTFKTTTRGVVWLFPYWGWFHVASCHDIMNSRDRGRLLENCNGKFGIIQENLCQRAASDKPDLTTHWPVSVPYGTKTLKTELECRRDGLLSDWWSAWVASLCCLGLRAATEFAVLTQGPPVSRTQCVAPWPPTHPCGAPTLLSLPVDCDRGERRLSQSATSSHVQHRSSQFLWIVTPPPFCQLSRLFINTPPLHYLSPSWNCLAHLFHPPCGFWLKRATQTLGLRNLLRESSLFYHLIVKYHGRGKKLPQQQLMKNEPKGAAEV